MMLFLSFFFHDGWQSFFSFQALADLMRTLKPGGWIELLEVKINWVGGWLKVVSVHGLFTHTHTCYTLQHTPLKSHSLFRVHRYRILNMRMLVPRSLCLCNQVCVIMGNGGKKHGVNGRGTRKLGDRSTIHCFFFALLTSQEPFFFYLGCWG